MKFSLNQATAPRLRYAEFLDLAASLGCVGVEPRNDLARPLFDGMAPEDAGALARSKGLELVGLSQVYPFNDWSRARARDVSDLIAIARKAGAATISLIPRVDGLGTGDGERLENLLAVLSEILPMVKGTGVTALVEPIGFADSSLWDKAELVGVIDVLGAKGHIRVLHDTFQHTIAGGGDIFAAYTGLVHISGISEADAAMDELLDGHRVLIDADDRIGNTDQITTLIEGGYTGPFSYECTDPEIHALADPGNEIARSFRFIRSAMS